MRVRYAKNAKILLSVAVLILAFAGVAVAGEIGTTIIHTSSTYLLDGEAQLGNASFQQIFLDVRDSREGAPEHTNAELKIPGGSFAFHDAGMNRIDVRNGKDSDGKDRSTFSIINGNNPFPSYMPVVDGARIYFRRSLAENRASRQELHVERRNGQGRPGQVFGLLDN